MTTACTGMSHVAIMGIQEISQNVLLLCNQCVKMNKRDNIIDRLASSKEQEKLPENELKMKETIDAIKEKLEQFGDIRSQLESVQSEVKKQFTTFAEKVKEKPTKATTTPKKENYDGIRLRGIPERNGSSARERLEKDLDEVQKIVNFLEIDCMIEDAKRVGNYDQSKTRTLVVKLVNEHHRRLTLLSVRKLASYTKEVYMSKELNPDEQKLENNALKLRRHLIQNETVSSKDLRIRNLKLQKKENDQWQNVEIVDTEASNK